MVEKLITVAKTNNEVSALRLITARMGGQKDVAFKVIKDIAPKYKDRMGGYIRVLKLPPRVSDGAAMALIELV
jgi:large subunit ribosomal protein L17